MTDYRKIAHQLEIKVDLSTGKILNSERLNDLSESEKVLFASGADNVSLASGEKIFNYQKLLDQSFLSDSKPVRKLTYFMA